MVGIGRTFEPTRSGTGSFARSRHAHALGQGLPLIRTLLQILHHGSQARLRTCPDLLGDGGDGLLWSQVGQEEGRVQIALHRSQPACAGMPALRPGFLHIPSTVMAILTQFGLECRDFDQGAASFCNQASHMRYKQPWGAKAHAPTILLLPSFERGLFDMDGVAYFHDVMSQLAMQALAVGCQSPLRMGVLPPCSFVPFTLFPTQTRCAVLLDTPLLIVVLWIM